MKFHNIRKFLFYWFGRPRKRVVLLIDQIDLTTWYLRWGEFKYSINGIEWSFDYDTHKGTIDINPSHFDYGFLNRAEEKLFYKVVPKDYFENITIEEIRKNFNPQTNKLKQRLNK